MFRVGMRVVCVWSQGVTLSVGAVYTVASVNRGNLVLAEITPEFFHEDGSPIGFFRSKFRPAVERPTSIEVFRAMLNPSKQGADA